MYTAFCHFISNNSKSTFPDTHFLSVSTVSTTYKIERKRYDLTSLYDYRRNQKMMYLKIEYILETEAKKVAQINDAFAKPIARFYFAKFFEERRVVRLSYDDL